MMSSGDDVRQRLLAEDNPHLPCPLPNFDTAMTGNCFRVFCKIVGLSAESTTSRQHGNKTHLIVMFLLMPEAER
jgi:hypothetical protein